MADTCSHLDSVDTSAKPGGDGCEECLATGGTWVALRMCVSCGHIGCCDSSPGVHATGHHQATQHPLMRSYEPGQSWWWCYPEQLSFEPDTDPFAGVHHA